MEKKSRKTAVVLSTLALLGCESIVNDSSQSNVPTRSATIFIKDYSASGASMRFATTNGDHILDAKNENEYKIGTNAHVKVVIPHYDTVIVYNTLPNGYEKDSVTGEYLNTHTAINRLIVEDSASYRLYKPQSYSDNSKVYTVKPIK